MALWLNSTGFTCPESTEAAAVSGTQKRSLAVGLNQVPGAMASAKPLPEVNKGRMHLILGRCPHGMCQGCHLRAAVALIVVLWKSLRSTIQGNNNKRTFSAPLLS